MGNHHLLAIHQQHPLWMDIPHGQDTGAYLPFVPDICRMGHCLALRAAARPSARMVAYTMHLYLLFMRSFIYFNTKPFLRNLFPCYFYSNFFTDVT